MEYTTLSSRLVTFEPPTKRSKAGWPHSTPTADSLARAGFYYKPRNIGSDNTICFLCDRALDGWEEDDDPVQEHVKHSPECGWAIMMDIMRESSFAPTDMEDPTGERIVEARRATFSIGWPHESKRGWTCKTEKLVEAGWHFAPTSESEDFVSCAYCKLSLDGWEPKDNPFDEHYRRSPDCPFFVFAGTTAPSKRPKAKKGRVSRSSRSSKASRLSTQSNMSIASEVPSIPDLDESIDTSTVSIMSTMSTASTTAKKGKRKAAGGKKATRTKKTKTRASTRAKKTDVDEEDEAANTQLEQELEQSQLYQETAQPIQSPQQDTAISYPQIHDNLAIPAQIPSPSPKAPKPTSAHKPRQQSPLKSPIPIERSPTQDSDIENAPPSTRPSSVRPPLSSPGEAAPEWTPIDLDLVFETTPAATTLNATSELSEEEKQMTVQEWIEHIAQQAEGDLRAEAERMVGTFEKEGARAMGVLEAIVCV